MITLTAQKMNFKLSTPATTSCEKSYFTENVIISLRYKELLGLGEASPYFSVTRDTQEEVLQESAQFSTLPFDPEHDSVEVVCQYLKAHVKSSSLRAAIDFGYHDLLGKLRHIPAYQLYAPTYTSVVNSITLFIKDTVAETIQHTEQIYHRFPSLRVLKIKLKGEQDIERVKAIKDISPDHMQFILDANQGFRDPRDAVRTLSSIQDILGTVLLVEEPCPMKDLKKLKYVKEGMQNLPVFADESAASFEDVQAIASSNAASGINIKLQKTGGISEAKRIARLCNDNGLSIMVGCMLEGPVGVAAGVAFAVTTTGVVATDLDFDLEIPQHTKERCPFIQGERHPLPAPGFGISFDEDKLAVLKTSGELKL